MSEQMSLEQIVDEELETLTDRERYVLEQRYGYRGEPVTQKELGAAFGVSGSRIGQIEEAALRKLRYPFDRIKRLESFLPQAISRGKDDFYARLFIKLFKVKPEHMLERYKQEVRRCLMKDLPLAGKEYIEERMKLYEDEFPQFLKDGWTPGGVAAALIMGY